MKKTLFVLVGFLAFSLTSCFFLEKPVNQQEMPPREDPLYKLMDLEISSDGGTYTIFTEVGTYKQPATNVRLVFDSSLTKPMTRYHFFGGDVYPRSSETELIFKNEKVYMNYKMVAWRRGQKKE